MMRRRSAYLGGLATGIMMLASLTATADAARPSVAPPPAPAATAPNGVTGGPVAACVPRQPICLPFTVVDNRGYVAPPNDVMEAIPFTIEADNRVTVRLQNLVTSDGSRCLTKGVRAPDGRLVDGETFRVCPLHDGLFEWGTTLSVGGAYTLLLDIGQQAGATGRVDVTLYQTAPDDTGTLPTNGTEQRVDLGSPGQRAYRSFTGAQGDTLRLIVDPGDSFNNDPNDLCRLSALLRVVKPDGLNLYPTNDTWACVRTQIAVTLSLPQTGTYWIKIDPDYWATGSIDLKLARIPAVTRCDPSSVLPIMMVHGFNEQPGVFDTMRTFLIGALTEEFKRDGIAADRAAACAPGYVRAIDVGRRGSSRANAEIIKAELADLLAATGKPRADIIAHSKGGLDSRIAVATLQNPQSVRNLAMIGTPNGGARMAAVGCGVPNFPALQQNDREFRAVATNVLSTLFGECDGPEDGLYGLTEDFVQNELNPATPDNPNVFYTTIFGDASNSPADCLICFAMRGLMGPNDIIIPVHSALHLRGRGYWPIGPFNADHDELLTRTEVLNDLYCVALSGRNRPRTDPDRTCDRPDQRPQTPPLGNAAHIDAVPVPAGGSTTITLPVAGAGPGGLFVLTDGAGLTATANGVNLIPAPGFYGDMLLGQLDGASDISLTISNPGDRAVSAMVGVGTDRARELDIVLTPEVPKPGQPVQIKLTGQAPAGLFGVVTAPNGTETTVTFAGAGSDSVATFTPTVSGQFRVAVGHKGTNQARRFGFRRLVVGAGAAAPTGTVRTSLTRSGADNLADALNVDVDVTATQAGQYTLSAALVAADTPEGTLIAHTRTTRQLAAGATTSIRLVYRGPVIYGANRGASFRLADVTLLRPGDVVEAQAATLAIPTQYPRDTFRPTRIDPGFVDVREGGQGARTEVRPPATLSERINDPVTVNFGSYVQDGSATWPEDYDAVLGGLRYLPGETVKTIPMTIKGDDLDENDEPAFFLLGGEVNATIGGFHVGGANIRDDDPVIMPGFAAATVEGNSGTTIVAVPVTLASPPAAWPVTVQYAPYDAPGFAKPGQDFDAPSGTLTFQTGQLSKTIPLTIRADTLDEDDELALIALTNPNNGSVGGLAIAGVQINDDDPAPVIEPGFAAATVEGNSGTKVVAVPVTLSEPSGRTVTVRYGPFTQPGGYAVFPGDFDVVPGTLTFQPGETSKTIALTIKADTLDENDEGALIALDNPVNATVGGYSVAGVTILDDD
ncbi:MAG TPA: Calx-beta domain-containing protein [Actinophytocola sp.]|uniref:Calx-beta domain-containing protein n=1 Tax=Actinophytocola sp. TaxID=1872138 RepID=UPI002DDDA7C9|nr:Calx-beta domain-containing protein [Actinophytocola sp.]HEV2778847.1 Calx-beta domain-containing protein [Actinophytocola sp.]